MCGSVRQVQAGGGRSPRQVSEAGKQVREGEARLVPSPSVQGSHKSSEGVLGAGFDHSDWDFITNTSIWDCSAASHKSWRGTLMAVLPTPKPDPM